MYLYLYDFVNARQTNARRVAFTKELYGYTYSWKTKAGLKQRRKPGIIEECPGSRVVTDSAILVPDEHKSIFDMLFRDYQDIMELYVFQILHEEY